MVVATAQARDLREDVLTLTFPSENDANGFRRPAQSTDTASEHLRAAIQEVLGIRVKFLARVLDPAAQPLPSEPAPAEPLPSEPARAEPDDGGWYVTPIPDAPPQDDDAPIDDLPVEEPPMPGESPDQPSRSDPDTAAADRSTHPVTAPAAGPAPQTRRPPREDQRQRYGEAVVRELLGASFLEEHPVAPTVKPMPRPDGGG